MLKAEEIGAKVKELREQAKLSQVGLVEKLTRENLNISRETLSKIESGNRTISAIELKAICNVLNINIDELFNNEEEKREDLVTMFRKRYFIIDYN